MDIPTPDDFTQESADRIVDLLKREMRNSANQYGNNQYIVTLDVRGLDDWDAARRASRGFESQGWNMFFRNEYRTADCETYTVFQYFIWPRDSNLVPVEVSSDRFHWVDEDEVGPDDDVMNWP